MRVCWMLGSLGDVRDLEIKYLPLLSLITDVPTGNQVGTPRKELLDQRYVPRAGIGALTPDSNRPNRNRVPARA